MGIVRVFSFQIDPVANLNKRKGWNGRNFCILALKRNLPSCRAGSTAKSSNPAATNAPRTPPKPGPAAAAAQPRPKAIAICRFINAVIATRQLRHGDYAISTSQMAHGSWIASFGRPDGKLICVDGKQQAVPVTGQYFAETLAIADALLRIEALADGR